MTKEKIFFLSFHFALFAITSERMVAPKAFSGEIKGSFSIINRCFFVVTNKKRTFAAFFKSQT